ncbi:DUF397 domain-containing protein [Streptomyces fuscichromogenes]|uniref:DUF397 domain-containing protein n=1 Tax=Streptomyces fuscichromogenes TaxID=1324013 RepID=UPI00382FC260
MTIEKLSWFKSSHSSGGGGECLETAYTWRKSSYSSGEGGQCVEVGPRPSGVHVRDSKRNGDAGAPLLCLSASSWAAFLGGVAAS